MTTIVYRYVVLDRPVGPSFAIDYDPARRVFGMAVSWHRRRRVTRRALRFTRGV